MPAPITVVGSLNMDFVAQVTVLPMPGQTAAPKPHLVHVVSSAGDLAEAELSQGVE